MQNTLAFVEILHILVFEGNTWGEGNATPKSATT